MSTSHSDTKTIVTSAQARSTICMTKPLYSPPPSIWLALTPLTATTTWAFDASASGRRAGMTLLMPMSGN